jgi:hypothetical protein
MALDTKPNLNSGKFEQFSGDTLNISGTSRIYGNIEYAGSAPTIPNGNSLASRSYVTGLTSTLATTANNGILKTGQNFRLGGNLTGATTIGLGTNNLTLSGTTGTLRYETDQSANFTNRSLVDKEYVDSAISGLTGSSSSGDRIVKQFTQSGHTFSIGNVVEYSGSTFIKALAVSGRNSEIIGVVSQIIDANNFNVTIAGYIDGLTGLTANTTYYVSSTVAGALTTIEPTQDNTVSKPMLTTFTSSDGIVFQYRGIVNAAATSASTITTLSMGVSAISPITAGQKGRYMIGYSGILRGWTLISDQPTTIVLDVWKASNTIPTVANTIFGTKPSLTSSEINSATGLNIAVSANDVFILNVDSNDNANYIKLDLQITQE